MKNCRLRTLCIFKTLSLGLIHCKIRKRPDCFQALWSRFKRLFVLVFFQSVFTLNY